VIQKEWRLKKIPRPCQEDTLPQIISTQDVVKLINQAGTYKQQAVLCFVYSTGMQLIEALNITFTDINRDSLQRRFLQGNLLPYKLGSKIPMFKYV